MTSEPILTSRDIGETENALRAILVRTLSGTGLDYARWVALKVVSEGPREISTTELSKTLKAKLRLDDATAREMIDDLQAKQILDAVDDGVSITPDGLSLHRRLVDDIKEVSVQIYAGLAPADLATAYRVLSTIRERANAVLFTVE